METIRILGPPLLIAVGFVLLVFVLQRRLIYFPSLDPVPSGTRLPTNVRELQIPTSDGLTLGAWLIPARKEASAAIVIVFNGNAGDRSLRLPLAEALSAAGYAVLLFDYRGYGGNPGRPSEIGLRRDARAVRRFLVEELGAVPDRLVYFGESLGTGVAVTLAVEHPPAALVLRSPFPSLVALGRTHYPWLPVSLLLRDRFDSLGRIPALSSPLLVVAGERDRIVPARLSRRLYDGAPQPKEWVEIPGADHNDWELLAGERMIAATVAFLEQQGM
ncbi:MAG TPA: alpha/beta fold hydrolase [Thermoanaerobaculia bacterium]|nr:alpha/beta fold hydrolase [Thermoanaerobaculia bacterium]